VEEGQAALGVAVAQQLEGVLELLQVGTADRELDPVTTRCQRRHSGTVTKVPRGTSRHLLDLVVHVRPGEALRQQQIDVAAGPVRSDRR
jgi:hypothetical protein